MARKVFLRLLDEHLRDARVRMIVGGETTIAGGAELADATAEPIVTLRVHDDRFFARVLSEGNLGLGESFMDGDVTVERGEMHDLLAAFLRNRVDARLRGDLGTILGVLRVQAANVLRRWQWRHVQQHYDLGDDLFESFLDDTMMYSCGYAEHPDDPLERLQENKLDRICRKLDIRPGDRLLDIGCGFGGLLIHAAERYGARGMGITTSERHCARGNANIEKRGLASQIRIELRDHRTIDGQFDRVVSVGMMEHLPRREYGRYVDRIAGALAPDGIGLVHAIGVSSATNVHDPFIQKYIFPGSGQIKLSEFADHLERRQLYIRDVENMARHYAYTAKEWLRRFRENAGRLDPTRYGGAFARMWEYYLHCAIACATGSDSTLYQVLFMKDYAAPMPLRRV